MQDKVYKVFMSYSWSSEDVVISLAQRLVSHGVDVVLDKWDLKPGQDKYVFMEQCVNDDSIDKVLIVCDKIYAEKANLRAGGVGDETVIISNEIYGKTNQEKFIPIIAERDEEGKEYLPTYIKSRIYIDLSDEEKFESEYEKLLRNIYEKPLYRKPRLGARPDWIDEEKTNLFPLTDIIRQIKGATTQRKEISCVERFISEYIETLKTYHITSLNNSKQVFDTFVEMKAIRDVFLDFLSVLHETELSFTEIICNCFEKLHNTLICAKGCNENACFDGDKDYEIYRIHIWELFICLTAFLRYKQDYKSINDILTNTYFLTSSTLSKEISPKNYCAFRHYSRVIEEEYKPTTDRKRLFTLLGDEICNNREKLPIYTKETIAEADVFLYQVRNALDLTEDDNSFCGDRWFPNLYIYANEVNIEWKKMKSKKYCTKMFDLFNVTNIEELKKVISKCTCEREIRYGNSFDSAPAILSCIKIEEIGLFN